MEIPRFHPNDRPTLGVEIELQLVDARTMALTSAFDAVQAGIPEPFREKVKPELMQCYLEINTEVCHTVADVERDLKEKIRVVEQAAAARRRAAALVGDAPVLALVRAEDHAARALPGPGRAAPGDPRRLVVFGLHVHVGLDSGDKAVMISDRILRHLPTLLALSANSPFWSGRNTGLHS